MTIGTRAETTKPSVSAVAAEAHLRKAIALKTTLAAKTKRPGGLEQMAGQAAEFVGHRHQRVFIRPWQSHRRGSAP